MSEDEELVPFDISAPAPGQPITYVRVPPGWPGFKNLIPRDCPDKTAQALGRALAGAGTEEEAAEVYLSAMVRAGVVTEAEADDIRGREAG